MFSARSIRQHSTAAGGNAEMSIPTAISIAKSSDIVEDWRSSLHFGTQILRGNDVEEVLVFSVTVVISWTSDRLSVGYPKAVEHLLVWELQIGWTMHTCTFCSNGFTQDVQK